MTSQKQIESNRRNALRSTGPRTPEGKAASRSNALQHGLTAAAQVVIAGEDPGQYARLLESIRIEYAPSSEFAVHLVEQLAQQLWRLRRVPRFESALLAWRQRADLIADKRVPPMMKREESIYRLPVPTDAQRAPSGARGSATDAGERDFDDLHRLGRTVQKLLSDEDYLHRLGRYETMLAKNCDRTLHALLRLKGVQQPIDGEAATEQTRLVSPQKP